MPLLTGSGYVKRPSYMLNAHWETIIPSMFFKIRDVYYSRQRLELDDGDFLDVDWVKNGNKRCIVLSHGLEGGSDRYYVKRAARYFSQQGWDIAAWNCRSCSGEINRLPRFYHHGETEDLHQVVQMVVEDGYEEVVLVGYSMGGSMTLKYLGERKQDSRVKCSVVFSVPCNLRDSARQLLKKANRIYEQRFMKKLVVKMKQKALKHPAIDVQNIDRLKDFDAFHELYTAPLHGFASGEDFFVKATCDQYMHQVQVPVLVVNAANDPMLGPACYPVNIAEASKFVNLEVPRVGGHVGFTIHQKPYSYMELRAEEFIEKMMG